MKYLLLIILFISFTKGIAQVDKSKIKTLKIEAIDTSDVPKKSIAVKPSAIIAPTKKKTNKPIDFSLKNGTSRKRSGVDFTNNSRLPLPQWNVKQKFGEDVRNIAQYKKDFFLGNINTKSKHFRIRCRDHEYVDGDRIKLLLNGEVIIPNITLQSSFYVIDVILKEGHNTIEFLALNEGTSSPNTAQLEVFDENEVLVASNQWLITTGYKAQLRVFKN
ncbi:hypothetical protein D7030_04235 [Flavobacteriaceae bacterium AU392]|nr:hypothetical protein D1817_10710 [Flavobacteriaceae bacterium]RKM85886.1 hypothetical protein D7030_04235 [Flavobacteriaceae bacterium AU392]